MRELGIDDECPAGTSSRVSEVRRAPGLERKERGTEVSVEPSFRRAPPGSESGPGCVGRAPAVTPRRVAGVAGVVVTVWAILAGLLILGGEGIKHSSAVTSVDRRVTAFMATHRTVALDELMKAVTWAGSWIALLGMAILVAVLAWRRRLPFIAVIAVLVAWWGQLLAVSMTKAVVQRPRPPEALRVVAAHGWAFPSGHAANATVVFAAGASLVSVFVSKQNWRAVAWALAVLATALVGFSRIELGVHWMTDVVASLVWTTGWLLIVVRVLGPIGAGRRTKSRTNTASSRRRAGGLGLSRMFPGDIHADPDGENDRE